MIRAGDLVVIDWGGARRLYLRYHSDFSNPRPPIQFEEIANVVLKANQLDAKQCSRESGEFYR